MFNILCIYLLTKSFIALQAVILHYKSSCNSHLIFTTSCYSTRCFSYSHRHTLSLLLLQLQHYGNMDILRDPPPFLSLWFWRYAPISLFSSSFPFNFVNANVVFNIKILNWKCFFLFYKSFANDLFRLIYQRYQ